jgi:acetyl-CoA C-acetyltransferase
MAADDIYIAGMARTPIGGFQGELSPLSAPQLGAQAIKGALAQASLDAAQVGEVYMGCVLPAAVGQAPARQASIHGGVPQSVPCTTVSKVCGSGMKALMLAADQLRGGSIGVALAGGMESMTNAPYIAPGARGGFRFGDTQLLDAIQRDGLWCAFDACLMGLGTERYAAGNISREAQDDLAMKSNQRAAAAIAAGRLAEEIVPVAIPQRKGDPVIVDTDEGVRASTTMESLAGLKPAFDKAGTITAGNASQISDAGSAVVLMSKKALDACGATPLGQFVSYGMVAGPDSASLLHQPSRSIMQALGKAGMSVKDVNLFEINEAFAAVGIASMKELGISDEIVNVNGGAIALGHPIGMSGNRLALTLLYELRRRGGGTGAAALCGGGGQGDALVVRTV